jgi:hypothetical protein
MEKKVDEVLEKVLNFTLSMNKISHLDGAVESERKILNVEKISRQTKAGTL